MTSRQDSLTDEQDAWLASNQDSFPDAVPVERIWTQADREESVDARFGGRWRMTDLRDVVKDQPVFDLPLEWIDLANYTFDVSEGLVAFARHFRHANEADLQYPIIMDEWGGVLDGRHRILKALVTGQTTIKCVRVPYGAIPTHK